jgi:hypothetical protein
MDTLINYRSNESVDYKEFEHPDFKLEVPVDWVNVPSSIFEAVFVMPPFPEGSGTNVSISITKAINPFSMYEVADKLKAMQQEQYPDYQIHDEGVIPYPTRQGYGRYYTWTNTDQQLPLVQSQLIFMTDSGYESAVLTATRPALLPEQDIETFNSVYTHMAATFRFNNET